MLILDIQYNKEWCQENYLDFRNLKLAVQTCKQLRDICVRNEISLASSPANTVNVRRALISGMFVNSAEHFRDNEYKTVRKSRSDYCLKKHQK